MSSDHEKIWRLIDDLVTLPTLPTVLQEVNTLVENPSSSANDVATVIQADVAIATKVLRLANSAYYGLRSKVTSVQHAIAMLGFNIIKNLAITATVFEQMGEGPVHQDFSHEDFWKHSVATGMVAKLLADRVGLGRKELEAMFVCGLLHDVGKIILEQHIHESFVEALDVSRAEQMPLYKAEQQVMEFTHADVGALLADRWRLAPEVISAAQWHHAPLSAPDGEQLIPCLVHVADFIARVRPVGHGGGAVHPRMDQAAWDALGLKPNVVTEIIRELDDDVEQEAVMAAA